MARSTSPSPHGASFHVSQPRPRRNRFGRRTCRRDQRRTARAGGCPGHDARCRRRPRLCPANAKEKSLGSGADRRRAAAAHGARRLLGAGSQSRSHRRGGQCAPRLGPARARPIRRGGGVRAAGPGDRSEEFRRADGDCPRLCRRGPGLLRHRSGQARRRHGAQGLAAAVAAGRGLQPGEARGRRPGDLAPSPGPVAGKPGGAVQAWPWR